MEASRIPAIIESDYEDSRDSVSVYNSQHGSSVLGTSCLYFVIVC